MVAYTVKYLAYSKPRIYVVRIALTLFLWLKSGIAENKSVFKVEFIYGFLRECLPEKETRFPPPPHYYIFQGQRFF